MENLDSLIINRLGEHQRKIDIVNSNINGYGKTDLKFKKIRYTILSVAACLAIVLVISPMLFKSNDISDISITAPSFTEYRGTSFNNIETLIRNGRYEDALLLVKSELTDIDNELERMSSSDMSEDEKLYLTTLYKEEREELIWCEIYLSVKLDRKDEAKANCHNYLNNNEFVRHKSEVENFLKKIQ